MKIRTGFVSNSSSSSFICDYCGDVESGYDMSMEDVGHAQFSCGHEVCLSHIPDSVKELDEWEEHGKKNLDGRCQKSGVPSVTLKSLMMQQF